MTDDAKFCHEYDMGSALLAAGSLGALKLSAVSEKIRLRMVQAGGAKLPDVDHGKVVGSHAMCENLHKGFDKRSKKFGSMEMEFLLKEVGR